MRTPLFTTLATLLIWGGASAQSNLPSVEVRIGSIEVPDQLHSVEIPCAKPASVALDDVKRVLSVRDDIMAHDMRHQLIPVVTNACNAGLSHVVVTRSANGDLIVEENGLARTVPPPQPSPSITAASNPG